MAETIDIRELNERIERQSAFVTNLTTGMDQVIVGQKHLVESLLIGLLSDGHVLLEGVPGLAKTLAIKTLASLIDAQYSRIQFTPDLLPADVISTMVIDYPKLEEEKLIIRQNINGDKFEVKPILKADEIIEARKVVRQVYLDEKIEKYIVDIVFATRYPEKYDLKELKDMIGFGGSPRASINLALAARSYAFIKRRGYVIPEDVRAVAHDVLRHRIGLTYEAEASNMTSDEIVSKILNKVEVP